ncbi:hypothetical protein NT6N_12060 [Oceaniferula spumae]|uniref:DUF4440 domain-containing protein n=1 Tax=Oceaniferula spumae TaxID=2979115 RepID=A0AAT9FJN1_9BACT
MKRYIILFALLVSALPVIAQTEEDKQALRDLKATYESAIKNNDLTPLKKHLTEDFSAVMLTGEEVKSFDELQAFWDKAKEYMGEDSSYSVSVSADDSTFIDNIAIAKGSSKDSIDTNGSTLDFSTAWTAVCRKMPDGTWKLARLQVTTHPVDNPFAKLANKMTLWITAMATGFVALLIGLIAGKRMGYKKAMAANG